MDLGANKALVRRFIEQVFVEGREAAVDELVTPDFLPHSWGSVEPGGASLKAAIQRVSSGLSEPSFVIEDLIAEGDRVVARVTASATHRGVFMGLPATGRRYTIAEIHIFRVRDGRIAEHWHVADLLGMMRQLGAQP